VEHVSLDIDLDVLDRHARQLDLYDPTVGRLIDVGRRVPELPGLELLRRSKEMKMTVE
jgi:hypothetical protein